eukprot:CAMPEP_0185834838 /NCGR_PEP_ID=MMETSP1353-20130828/6357_1 /TAXON_ID=1077150 /ORGANISM="Erythrolobus australicus, Strain CCMP3124" /LENGTH=218 /DNA_ID=CAMNT_0028533347 /DNA_START=23 /DNA_END=675 /DNA_ORIENTATION=-
MEYGQGEMGARVSESSRQQWGRETDWHVESRAQRDGKLPVWRAPVQEFRASKRQKSSSSETGSQITPVQSADGSKSEEGDNGTSKRSLGQPPFDLVGSAAERITCPHCNATFSQKSHMYCHVRAVHEKLKQHYCEQCDTSFSRGAYLRRHVAVVHEKVRDLKCSQCELTFGWRSELAEHVKTAHEPRELFECSECEAKYMRKKSLKRHVQQVHSGATG